MDADTLPTSRQLVTDICLRAMRLGLNAQIVPVVHRAGVWPMLWLFDPQGGLKNGTFLLTATQHATEVAGAITVHRRLPEIVARTRAAGLRLACAPLMDASGYDHRESGRDRNVDNDGGAEGTNDYLRYLLSDGTWTGLLKDGQSFERWEWSSAPEVNQKQPVETLAMHGLLKRLDWSKVRIAIDAHQDNLTEGLPPGAYQYTFGDASRYHGIIERIRTLVPVLSDLEFRFDRNNHGNVSRTDAHGCIQNFHDGTLSDLAYRQGVPHALTIETSGTTPLETAIKVTMSWIHGLCGLVSSDRP